MGIVKISPVLESLFDKVADLKAPVCESLYYKETPTQVFSCEYRKIFKSTYFEDHMQTTSSVSEWVGLHFTFLVFIT